MKFLSLFAGIGGFDLGLERAGMTCVGQVEIDEYCRAVLTKHWPDVPRFGDITKVTADDIRSKCGSIDLICGGFPCQDISVAGKGAGLEGLRSGLWREMRRLIDELRPAWLLVENSPALRTRGADTICPEVEEMGYAWWATVVGARHVGALHIRNRTLLLAHSNSKPLRFQSGWSSGQNRQEEIAHRATDSIQPDSDLISFAPVRAERGSSSLEAIESSAEHPCSIVGDVLADYNGEGLEGTVESLASRWPKSIEQDLQHDWEAERLGLCGKSGMALTVHGIPWGLAVRSIGNAVVPQVVEVYGRAIMRVTTQVTP